MTNTISPRDLNGAAADALERKRAADRLARSLKSSDAEGAEPAAKAAAPAGDQLQLSAVALQSAQEPQFDRSKFEAIKQAVAQGEYVVDHRKAAAAFLDLEQMIKD
jgi:flagellar biosynthesis anti-sigma factor FlgM